MTSGPLKCVYAIAHRPNPRAPMDIHLLTIVKLAEHRSQKFDHGSDLPYDTGQIIPRRQTHWLKTIRTRLSSLLGRKPQSLGTINKLS